MIERSGEIIQFKQRLHTLSHQRFAGEVDNALMMATLRQLLARQTGEGTEDASTESANSQSAKGQARGGSAAEADDDIGPITKGILIGIMLISVGLIVMGLMQK